MSSGRLKIWAKTALMSADRPLCPGLMNVSAKAVSVLFLMRTRVNLPFLTRIQAFCPCGRLPFGV